MVILLAVVMRGVPARNLPKNADDGNRYAACRRPNAPALRGFRADEIAKCKLVLRRGCRTDRLTNRRSRPASQRTGAPSARECVSEGRSASEALRGGTHSPA